MKNFKENALVQKMNLDEMKEVNGGFPWWILGSLAYDIVSNWNESVESFNKGLSEGFLKWKVLITCLVL